MKENKRYRRKCSSILSLIKRTNGRKQWDDMNTLLPGDCDEPWEYEVVDFYFTMSKITAAKFEHNIRSSKKMLFVTRKVVGASKFVQWRFLSQPWLLDKMVDWFDTRNSDDFQTFNNFIRQTPGKIWKAMFQNRDRVLISKHDLSSRKRYKPYFTKKNWGCCNCFEKTTSIHKKLRRTTISVLNCIE